MSNQDKLQEIARNLEIQGELWIANTQAMILEQMGVARPHGSSRQWADYVCFCHA